MTESINGKTYGRALYELACEENASAQILSELKTVRSIIDDNPEYCAFLNAPYVNSEERIAAVREDFANASETVKNFLCLLTEKRTSQYIGAATDEYERLYDEDNGILKVTAVTAVPLSEKQREAIKKKLIKEVEGTKEVIIENKIDPSIIGGLILRYAGIQTDASLALQLKTMQASFNK